MAQNEITKVLSNRLEELTERKRDIDYRLSDKKQAEQMDIPYPTFGKYKGDKSECPISAIVKMAEFYGVSTDYLLGRTDVKSTDEDLQAISNSLGISEKAAENMRKAASGYWKPLNSVLENERFWQLLKIMETYSIAHRSDGDDLGKVVNRKAFSLAEDLLPEPNMDDLHKVIDAIFQSIFSQYIVQIVEDYNVELLRELRQRSKHKQDD